VILCSGGFVDLEYQAILSIATGLIAVWPVGMVLLYAAVLIPCRRALRAHTQTPILRASRFLHQDYEPSWFFWELVELVRRTILIGWVLLIPTSLTFIRLVVALLLSQISLTLVLSVKPYLRPEDDLLAAASHLALVLIFTGSTYIRVYEKFSLDIDLSVVQRELGFTSVTYVALPIIAAILVMIPLLLYVVVDILSKEGSHASILVASTRLPPELTVHKGQKWHLFLSHIVRSHVPSESACTDAQEHSLASYARYCCSSQWYAWLCLVLLRVSLPSPRVSGQLGKTQMRPSRGSCSGCF